MLNFNPPKPVKCKHCGYEKGMHKAETFQCPAKWSRGRAVGFTHFLETTYEPKPARGVDASEQPSKPTILDVGFKYENGVHTPTVLVGFAPNDWDARDAFVRSLGVAVGAPSSGHMCGMQGFNGMTDECPACEANRRSAGVAPTDELSRIANRDEARRRDAMYREADPTQSCFTGLEAGKTYKVSITADENGNIVASSVKPGDSDA